MGAYIHIHKHTIIRPGTDIQTTNTDRETDRQTDRQAERQTDIQTG